MRLAHDPIDGERADPNVSADSLEQLWQERLLFPIRLLDAPSSGVRSAAQGHAVSSRLMSVSVRVCVSVGVVRMMRVVVRRRVRVQMRRHRGVVERIDFKRAIVGFMPACRGMPNCSTCTAGAERERRRRERWDGHGHRRRGRHSRRDRRYGIVRSGRRVGHRKGPVKGDGQA